MLRYSATFEIELVSVPVGVNLITLDIAQDKEIGLF